MYWLKKTVMRISNRMYWGLFKGEEGFTRKVDAEEHDCQTLGTDLVWQDLSGVADQKTRPGQVVEEIVDVDHADDCFSGSLVSSDGVSG